MGQWDDVMDLEDFVKKHGDKYIKRAWAEHMKLHNMYESSHDKLVSLAKGIALVAEFIKEDVL